MDAESDRFGDTSQGYWSEHGATPEQARWRLAKIIYEAEGYLESEPVDWLSLPKYDQTHYYDLVGTILDYETLLMKALEAKGAIARQQPNYSVGSRLPMSTPPPAGVRPPTFEWAWESPADSTTAKLRRE